MIEAGRRETSLVGGAGLWISIGEHVTLPDRRDNVGLRVLVMERSKKNSFFPITEDTLIRK